MLKLIAVSLLVSLPLIIAQNEIVHLTGTIPAATCDRKSFVVIQDLKQKTVSLNTTVVTPELLSTTCTEASVPFCLGPYVVENKTTIEYKQTNLYLYEWKPSPNFLVDVLNVISKFLKRRIDIFI
jgi:hypothetical protein